MKRLPRKLKKAFTYHCIWSFGAVEEFDWVKPNKYTHKFNRNLWKYLQYFQEYKSRFDRTFKSY